MYVFLLQVKDYKEQLAAKEKETSKTMEQCTHLVRISEQRRQENLSLLAKMSVMENKSRELLQQQESTASSAVVGLTGLGNRLDSLLDRLVKSYSISETDIEVCIIFFRWFIPSIKKLFTNLNWNIFYFQRMKYTLMKLIQMETAAVIPNNKIVLQISLTLNISCPLLFLPSNQHQPIGIKGKMIKSIAVNIIY